MLDLSISHEEIIKDFLNKVEKNKSSVNLTLNGSHGYNIKNQSSEKWLFEANYIAQQKALEPLLVTFHAFGASENSTGQISSVQQIFY